MTAISKEPKSGQEIVDDLTQKLDEVVGHRTFDDGKGGYRHEPLTRSEADALWAAAEAATKARAEAMPTEEDAVRVMASAFQRLRELGWKESCYAPSGMTLNLIEPGSSGIHAGHVEGEWPSTRFWISAHCDLWPSRPCLFKIAQRHAERSRPAAE